jgi:DNA-binding NarL/FixJ family response regulator
MIGTKLKPTVVIAEDHLGYLERISKLLSSEFEIVAVATDGRRGLSAAIHTEPDVVILDISLPGLDGIEAAREIRKKGLESKILFVSIHEEPDFASCALQAGGNEYVFKSRMTLDLIVAMKEVLAGRMFLSIDSNYGYGSAK